MRDQRGETWRFLVCEPTAERVFLVRYSEQGLSLWTAMEQVRRGVWKAVMHLDPGDYRFAYFTCEGAAYFNGGTFGLSAQRLSDPDPRVQVEPLPMACLNTHDDDADVAATLEARAESGTSLGTSVKML